MQDSATTAIQADYPLGGMNIDVFLFVRNMFEKTPPEELQQKFAVRLHRHKSSAGGRA
jgi:hypothetical protein